MPGTEPAQPIRPHGEWGRRRRRMRT